MSNKEKYINAFTEALMVDADKITEDLKYQDIEEWDSVGHMELISALEDAFDISLETDDIVDLNSFKKGMEILKKYGIDVEV
ncbi:MAG: acyl carrier protein [Lachnoclostridium sp.]|nr:acyl carrier protein [Lachnospira sp.]MCM1247304.1 acyl carrier protein [Lachnoclostridium sp.]MCM1534394.1 acyl carrier protein [Clostridium sp.]